jgi:signal transduction histidine kinase
LLDLARFEGGAGLIEKKPFSSRELVEAVADRERELVTSRGLHFKVQMEKDLPSVSISRSRIDQVFSNFISNAVKHSPADGTITLSAKRDGAQVRFAVRDEGPGIAAQLHRRIFDKFYRVSETSSEEGAGLGLSIAREIVLAHSGTIGVESEPPKGSEFFFALPALI